MNLLYVERRSTSSSGQGGEFVFSNGRSSGVVGGDVEVVPSGRAQIQNDKVAARFNLVGHQSPFLVATAKTSKKIVKSKKSIRYWFIKSPN